ncbi:MAG: acetoacetate decarboxylase family protein [Promethearchaeota archaeon]
MSFVKTPEEIEQKFRMESGDFYDAEMLVIYWETKEDIIKRLLPPPLKPAKHPVASAFVANYPRTNFGVSYKEAALFIHAEHEGIVGMYCLSMPVDNDIALILGRETFGYPKKLATMHLKKEGDNVEGWFERHGIRVFEGRARLTNKPNTTDALKILMELGLNPSKPSSTVYNFKFFAAPDLINLDYNPRLMREEITMKPSMMKIGEGTVKLNFSEKDPWSEVEVVRELGALYLVSDNSMRPGTIVAEIDQETFRPYAYIKIDPFM